MQGDSVPPQWLLMLSQCKEFHEQSRWTQAKCLKLILSTLIDFFFFFSQKRRLEGNQIN